MTAHRAVALGYQGFGNVGDEAILAGIEELLRETSLEIRCVIAGDRAPVAAFGGAERITSRRLLPSLAARSEMRGKDLLLLAGGGLIHDHWPIVIPRYLAWSMLARAMGLRIAWVGVGVGPIRRGWARRLAGRAVRLADLVTVRDEASAEIVRSVSPGTRPAVIPDPAYFLPLPPVAARSGTAIIVRPPVPADASRGPALAGALADLALRRAAAGHEVVLVAMELAHDADFARMVAERVAAAGGPRPEVRPLSLDPATALAELATFDEAVSLRLHGLILCALAGTPCVPIVYDDKVAGAAAFLGLGEHAVPLAGVSGEILLDRLAGVATGLSREAVRQRVAEIREDRPRAAALIATVFEP